MARLPRLNLPDVPQQVVLRVNNRQTYILTRNDRVISLKNISAGKRQLMIDLNHSAIFFEIMLWKSSLRQS